jgi:gas vesicle protein
MGRRISAFLASLLAVPSASAQITNRYGYYGNDGIIGLIEHLIGISINNPYELVGLAATVGIMWVSTYIVFKIAITHLDEGFGDGSGVSREGYFADALGVGKSDQKNLLAVLTLLVVLTMMGTGYFMGLIRTWQSLIILTFAIMALALLIFIVVGGAYGTIGGVSITRGMGQQMRARGMQDLADAEERIRDAEERIAQEEREEEDEIDEGDEDEADQDAEATADELQLVIEKLEEVEEDIDHNLEDMVEEIRQNVEQLEDIISLLGDPDE